MRTNRTLLLSAILVVSIAFIVIVRLYHSGLSSRISPSSTKQECIKAAEGYLRINRPESAIYPLLLATQKDANDFRAHFLLAKAYHLTQVDPLARKECLTSLELRPQNSEALELLCQISFELGKSSWENKDLQPAISEFRLVLEKTQDQRLIDSIACLTGGRFRITRLTNDLFFDDAPSFSPDGKRIIFHSDTSYSLDDYGLKKIQLTKTQIFVMDSDGKNRTCLSPSGKNQPSERFARFSHDGKSMVYEKENSPPRAGDTTFSTNRDIFLKNFDTGEVRRLTNDSTYDGLPSFSPDDNGIIFVSDRPGGESLIYKLNLKTKETANIFLKESWNEKIGLYTRPREMVLPYYPSFSPDGKKILLHAGYETRGVFLLDTNGQDSRRLTDRTTDCFFPSFSPDGKGIVFVSGDKEEEDLYVMHANGSDRMRLTYDQGSKRNPTFSPDGRSIIFSAKREGEPDNYFEIYLLNLDQTVSREKLKERLRELEKQVQSHALSAGSTGSNDHPGAQDHDF
ncbi:MAG: hypothetical protein WCE90_03250 [Candidatus Zixiibacteriota bacterium]